MRGGDESTMLHSSGMTYDGMWENGIPAGTIHLGKGEVGGGGESTLLHSSGMTYDGMWENGIPACKIHLGKWVGGRMGLKGLSYYTALARCALACGKMESLQV